MWGRKNKWGKDALLLLEAFSIYEDSLCAGCYQSAFDAHNPMHIREYGVESVICLGCAIKEHVQQEEKLDPGEKLFVVRTLGVPVATD